jgi:hypothetical protein
MLAGTAVCAHKLRRTWGVSLSAAPCERLNHPEHREVQAYETCGSSHQPPARPRQCTCSFEMVLCSSAMQ